MEKLIKLLDLYRRENKTEELFWEPWTLVPLTWKDFIMLNRVMIISKEYGFIKRLVDTDNIDFSLGWEYCIKSIEEFDWLLRDNEDWLIMILSISDTPIDDLISYLK